MFAQVWAKIKEMIYRMIGARTIEQTLHIAPSISTRMSNAIDLWANMYEGQAPWLREPTFDNPTRVVSMGLPAMIASEKARMAVLEMQSEITAPAKTNEAREEIPTGDTQRAEYLNEQYKKLLAKLRPQLEYGIAKGGIVIKPYIVFNNAKNADFNTQSPEIYFDFIQADNFFPLAFDGSERVTEAAFVQTKIDKDKVYRRLEYHKIENGTVTVQNRAFINTNVALDNGISGDTDLGREIPLTNVPEWASLQPETKIQNVDRLLFAYFKMPEANTVDTHSPLGVSGYSRAVGHIKEADLQFSRCLWEYEATEAAIDIDRDALTDVQDSSGRSYSINPMLQARLFRRIDLGESNTYQPFLPAIRDTSLFNGLNNILMRIEDDCFLSRGTISDVSAEARTATELKILKQRTYSANKEIQTALEYTLRDVVYVMNVYCTLYGVVAEGEYEISFEWDDSIITDSDTELNKNLLFYQNGLISKVEMRMKCFGETESQAVEALRKIDEENQQAADNSIQQTDEGEL